MNEPSPPSASTAQQKVTEFLRLLPLTLAIAGLPEADAGKYFNEGQMENRGASLRAAWAFTLWGDPTLQLPEPESPLATRPSVRHAVRGNTISLYQPYEAHDPVTVNPYHSHMLPNARLAGLLYKDLASPQRRFAPLLFAEVHLPKAPHGMVPRLQSRLPADRYVFCWDPRRRSGYLLASPRPKDRGELHFHVSWESSDTAAPAAQSIVRSP